MSECTLCHKEASGGTWTDGDGYGDAKYVGIAKSEFNFYCWDCADKAPNLNNRIDAAFAEQGMCGFLKAWIGRCRNQKPCAEHENERCWKCGAPAIRQCPEAGSLVCGMPECAEHPHSQVHIERYEKAEREYTERKEREELKRLQAKYGSL